MSIWSLFKKEPAPVERPEVEIEVDDQPEETGRLTINAVTYDEENERIKVDMDWDDEFVNYLKRHGFTGTTDEVIVQRYVSTLYRNMIDSLMGEGKEFE